MATKKKSEGGEGLFIIPGLVLFLPFLIISAFTYSRIKMQYMQGANHRRIMDLKNVGPLVTGCGLFLGFMGFIIWGMFKDNAGIALLVAIPVIFISVKFAQRLAVRYMGAVVDPDDDFVAFPVDMQSYGIIETLTFRFIKDLPVVDTVNLSEIEKMTRQAGKHLFLHGAFGSRKISFSDKQKRDELMSAIQHLVGKKGILMSEMESY